MITSLNISSRGVYINPSNLKFVDVIIQVNQFVG